jgi:Acetyltransferase (GNAT) domain
MFDAAIQDQSYRMFAQSEAYAVAAAACGATVFRADLGLGQALVVQRGRMRLISGGPVWRCGTAAERRAALRRFARWPGVTVATPEEGMAGFGLIPLVTPMHHALWDLAGDLRSGMTGKWRNRLVAAERAGLRVARGGALQDLVQAEAEQRRARGYQALSAGFSLALPAEALRLWQWREGGRLGAGMAFVRDGATASYHLGWASEAARARGVHGLMLTRAAEALRAEGVRWLDLGVVHSDAAPGLARFKLGTGAGLRRMGATVLVVPG